MTGFALKMMTFALDSQPDILRAVAQIQTPVGFNDMQVCGFSIENGDKTAEYMELPLKNGRSSVGKWRIIVVGRDA